MAAPLSRTALHELNEQNFTDPLNEQNTAETTREVVAALIESQRNVVDDDGGATGGGSGGDGGKLYATPGPNTDGPMTQKATTEYAKPRPTNDVVGGPKSVIWLTHADAVAAGRPTDLSLDQIPAAKITNGNLARVDLPSAGQARHYTAQYDGSPTPQLRSFIDGRGVPDYNRSPQDGLVPLHWVPVDSPAAAVPAYPSLPAGYSFSLNELVRAYVAGTPTELFFAALKTGPLPAPSAAAGDANWRRVAEADVPTGGGTGGPGGAPQWVPGKQTAGALVFDQGSVYRVKQDIGNSQSAPGSNAAFYDFIGPGYSKSEMNLLLLGKQDKFPATARKIWYVMDLGQGNAGDGSGYAPFRTYGQADTVAQPGDAVLFLPSGTYNPATRRSEYKDQIHITKSLYVKCLAPVVCTDVLLVFPQVDISYRVQLSGFVFGGRLAICHQKTAPSVYVLDDCEVVAGGQIETYSVGTDGPGDTIIFNGLRANTVDNPKALLYFNERSDYNQTAQVFLNGGTIRPGGDLAEGASYGPNAASRVVISANTDLALVAGAVLSPTAGLVVDNRTGAGGGIGLETVNTYALTDAKRAAVADALIAQVAGGGQAWLLEPDGNFLGQVIVDNRTETDRCIITCHQQANPTTGATEFCWYRSVVQ